MPIENIITKSFKYAWHHKAFWFYGFWIALFAGGGSSFNTFDSRDLERAQTEFHLPQLIIDNLFLIIIVGTILILAGLIIGSILSNWASASIINGTKMLEDSKEVNRKIMGRVGKRTVWEMIVLRGVIPFLLTLALIAILAIPVVALIVALQEKGAWIALALVVIVLLALVPLFVYLGIIFTMASPFVVLERQTPISALKKSKELIKGKFWWTFLLGIILSIIAGIGSVAGLLIFIPVVIGLTLFVLAKIWVGVIIMGILILPCLFIYLTLMGFFVSVSEIGSTLWWLELKKSKLTQA